MHIRPETPEDIEAIGLVETAAFGRPNEALLVDKLRLAGAVVLSLVAVQDKGIVGHALFTKGRLVAEGDKTTAVALGPLSVHPRHQKQGIGGRLIQAGHQWIHQNGCHHVFVLGHSSYYPRFGYRPTALFGIRCQWDVAPEAFMICELTPNAPLPQNATFHYHPVFSEGE